MTTFETNQLGGYEEFIHRSRYALYLPEQKRRETWPETVSRYVKFWHDKGMISEEDSDMLFDAIKNLDVMPSMRALMTAGKALDRDNVAGFNCSYLPIDSTRAFDELMYVLMCGTGVGFSVERKYGSKLPIVAEDMHPTETVINVADSKIGWAKAYRELVALLYSGQIPKWDTSGVRPAGSPLKTFGGRASGPEPLEDLFSFTVDVFRGAAGRRLTTVECHDLACKIAQIVVVGGVRRSALISLSDPADDQMAKAKSIFEVDEYVLVNETDASWEYTLTMKRNQPTRPTYKVFISKDDPYSHHLLEKEKKVGWWIVEPQRALANNSACYQEKPSFESFIEEWKNLYESKSGERGMFSRAASQGVAARNGRRNAEKEFGTNPCSEIILRPYQFCNLSEVIIRPDDTLDSLKSKVRTATILGTLQATLTDFRYLRKVWQRNTEEEALLGVSLTGIMDHPIMSGEEDEETLKAWLKELREVAVETNAVWAESLGINSSAAITCVKPSGTVSQLVDAASGIHPRYSKYYFRRVRQSANDPLCQVLIDAGVPYEPDQVQSETLVFTFPKKAPETAVCTSDKGALEQLRIWKIYQDHWCEHKPSITVYYKDSEFLDVGQWLFNNFDEVSGVSFLPYSDHTYPQAPYEEIDEDTYNEAVKSFPENFSWDIVEHVDSTEGSQTLACIGGQCEL